MRCLLSQGQYTPREGNLYLSLPDTRVWRVMAPTGGFREFVHATPQGKLKRGSTEFARVRQNPAQTARENGITESATLVWVGGRVKHAQVAGDDKFCFKTDNVAAREMLW